MSDRIFVHYPACASKKYADEFDKLIRAHPSMGLFREHIEIFSTPHAVRQVRAITPIQKEHARQSYLLYALLFVVMKWRLPPTPGRLRARPLFREDRFKLRYHAREIDDCAVGVFVPHVNGKWTYDMWRNARRLMRQQKPVWQILGNKADGWHIAPLDETPSRMLRLNRKDTMDSIGLYTDAKIYPSLFTLIRDAIRGRTE